MSEVEFSLPVSKNRFTVENVQALMIIRGHTESVNGLRCYAQHLKVGSWKWFSISNYCRENRVKNGICVANHTSPIDVFMLSCDNSYALVSLCSWLWPGHTIDCNAFVAGINHFENEFTEDFIFIIFLLCVCACMHVVCVCVWLWVSLDMCVCVHDSAKLGTVFITIFKLNDSHF